MADDEAVRRAETDTTTYWTAGTAILWRYRENAGDGFHIARPVTVVRDDADLLAVWLAPGTECVKPVLADGTPVHLEPLESRYTKPRGVRRDRWFGTGVLKLARPGEPWSVWLFWEPGWRFKNWYVNLEEPLARWSGGVDSEDHFLDISVNPDRSWHWRDEDEFAQAQRDGLMDPETAARVREAGRRAVEGIRAWKAPYADGWQHWRPDPAWAVPSLPEDWDRTPAHVST
ncbi:cytidylyl-2-hydroxypropylphosphonate hydrolase [Streptomyces sp. NPDC004376]